MPTALITGGSAGLGLALLQELSGRGWHLITDGRDADRLTAATQGLAGVTSRPGDVGEPVHRQELVDAIGTNGLDLLVNNASTLGPTPLPRLRDADPTEVEQAYRINVFAPLQLIRLARPALIRARGMVLNISSDAAREPYEGWGIYGSSKAALDQLTAILAAEEPELAWYALDPGDMRTEMHQAAFPGEDISDRPLPQTVVAPILGLLETRPPSGRLQAGQLPTTSTTPGR